MLTRHVLSPGYNSGGNKKKLPRKKEGDNTEGMACIVIEQHLGDLEVADGDCSEQSRVLGPTNLQIDRPPLVKPAADYQGAGPMRIVTISPCRLKPCQSTENVDLGRS